MAVRDRVLDWVDRADARVVESLYAVVSVPTERVRTRLRFWGRPFLDPEAEPPSPDELQHTASWVIEQSRGNASVISGFAGFAGAASVPPEVLASTVHTLRLAQRLAIVYGFDPETDRGQMAMWRALAAGYEVELPERGTVGVRVRDLPRIVRGTTDDTTSVPARLVRSMVRSTTRMALKRVIRLVPLLSSGVAAATAHARTTDIGWRMNAVYQRMAEAPPPDLVLVEDAIEL